MKRFNSTYFTVVEVEDGEYILSSVDEDDNVVGWGIDDETYLALPTESIVELRDLLSRAIGDFSPKNPRPKIIWEKTDKCPDFITLPEYKTTKAAAFDMQTPIDVVVPARGQVVINSELRALIPDGYKIELHSRSGLSAKKGIERGAGLLDSDFRDPWMIVLFNHSDEDVEFKAGDRIVQVKLEENIQADMEWGHVPAVDETSNRTGGLGSTGV